MSPRGAILDIPSIFVHMLHTSPLQPVGYEKDVKKHTHLDFYDWHFSDENCVIAYAIPLEG